MKTNWLVGSVILAGTMVLHAQTNDLSAALRQGLFEEEANRNLDGAISNYQSLATQFDQDRQIAATAIFRLGECYRKLGRTNDAVVQYERIVREFSDQTTLVTLSRQNLTGLGVASQPRFQERLQAIIAKNPQDSVAATTDFEDSEIRRIQQLIQNSPDLINVRPSGFDFTPLGDAARQGQIKVATFLLDHGADINVKQRDGETALHSAARAGNRAMVELLLSCGSDVNAKDGSDKTALHLALERNYPAVAETLLAAKADVNAGDKYGNTPLTAAVKNDNYKLAAAMLALGANPNLQDKILPGQPQGSGDLYGTALHLAAARNNADMVALLLTNHADVKVRNIADWTPLDVAASVGATEVAAQLIGAGAEVNAAGPVNSTGGATALLRATGNDHSKTVKLLLEHGANPDTAYITGAGSTPLMLAAGQGNTEIAGLLVAHGARTDLKDNEHTTALYRAVNSGKVKAVQLLLAHGANPNERNPHNFPLLIIATVGNNSDPDMAAAFLKAKADVNAADSSGQTALYYAIRDGRKDLAEMLLAAGADPNLRDQDGQTPLDLAKRQSGSSGPDSIRIPAGVPSPLSYQSRNGSTAGTQPAPSASLADLLRKHGALDDLPKLDRIEVSRSAANYSAVLFTKGTNGWNRFSLLELIAAHYHLACVGTIPFLPVRMRPPMHPPIAGDQPATSNTLAPDLATKPRYIFHIRDGLPFPDFAGVVIRRATPDGKGRIEIKVDLASVFKSGDCDRDVWLEWGDVVEIPEENHPMNAMWTELPAAATDLLAKCLARRVEIRAGEQSTPLDLRPDFDDQGVFTLRAALTHARDAGLLKTSSNLSRVKVTRHDPATGKKCEWVLNCAPSPQATPIDVSRDFSQRLQAITERSRNDGQFGAVPDLWLRDGDVIEVPEK